MPPINLLPTLLRGVCLAAFMGYGAWVCWQDVPCGPVRLDDPDEGIDTAAAELVGIPDFSTRLPAVLKGIPQERPLLIVAPQDRWMSGDVARLATIVLMPRPVIRWQPGQSAPPAGPAISAILFYKVGLPPAVAGRAIPFGPDASIVLEGGGR